MSTINGVSSSANSSDPWAAMKAQRSQMQAKMFAKVDSDGSGSVDKAELQTMLSDISQKTGVSIGGNAADTFTKMDSNADGKLSSDELDKGMQSLMPPPPSTMDFAQTRSTGGSGDGQDATDLFSKLDTDGDGKLSKTEFDAGRPQGGPQGAGGAHGAHKAEGPPPSGGPSGAGGAGKTDSASKTYDKLDTNQDGTVSEVERLAGEIKAAIASAVTTSSDTTQKSKADGNAARFDVAQLAKMVYAQIAAGFSEQSSRSLSATA